MAMLDAAYNAAIWSWTPEATYTSQVVYDRFLEQWVTVSYGTLKIVTPASYFQSTYFKELPF